MSEQYNDADYIESVIKCLFRDKKVLQKAKDLQVKPEDFGTIDIYQAFVATALHIGQAPIEAQLCLSILKQEAKKRLIDEANKGSMAEFWEYIYNDAPINAEYITENLAAFIKFRRYQQLKVDNIGTPEELISQTTKLLGGINLNDAAVEVRTFDPFTSLVLTEHRESLGTGFGSVDGAAEGLQYQEYGLIIGHSGSGKTAMGTFSMIQNAKAFRKVLYLSLEEPAENICNRVYSNIFRIPYTDLHKGSVFAQNDLKASFASMTERDKVTLNNIKIHDLRGVTTMTPSYIASYLDDFYEKTGWWPDLVYIDQMNYIDPNETIVGEAEWSKYDKVSMQVDDLSNHLIGGQHKFSIWLLHQAGGKMARKFSNNEIAGFKGVIRPTDMVLAIGRDTPQDIIVSIFSLKSRHSKNFQFDFLAELEFMNFEQHDKAAEERCKMEDDDRKEQKGNFKNIPTRPMLPAAGGGFK